MEDPLLTSADSEPKPELANVRGSSVLGAILKIMLLQLVLVLAISLLSPPSFRISGGAMGLASGLTVGIPALIRSWRKYLRCRDGKQGDAHARSGR